MNNTEELEKFSEKEIKNFRILCTLSLVVIVVSVISVVIYLYIRYTASRDLSYCQDTGLYRTIQNDKVLHYTSDDSKLSNYNNSEVIATQLAGDISLTLLGNDFTTDINCSPKVLTYIKTFCRSLNEDSVLCLSDMFPKAYLEPFGDGEHIYYPYKMDEETLYSREWVDEVSLAILGYSVDSIIKSTEIPNNVKKDFGGGEVLGYIPNETPVSQFMSSDIVYEDGKFYVDVSKIRIDSMYGYVDFFGEQAIDLFSLTPSADLREINPEDRFTWILEDSETDGKWHNMYFSNKYSDTLSVISIKIKNGQAIDIEIKGFDS